MIGVLENACVILRQVNSHLLASQNDSDQSNKQILLRQLYRKPKSVHQYVFIDITLI